MAAFVMTNASVSIAGTDLSDHVKSVTIDASVNLVDDTAMGDVFQSNAAGLASWSISMELFQDYASSKTDAVLSQLMDIGDTVALVIKPVAASVTSTNPSYSCTGILESYNPIAGTVGDQAMASVSFASASVLTRNT
tara:strand:+ start:122 stop:532 length:411 start_codon:yes stop_codon:yes gene_type:complete